MSLIITLIILKRLKASQFFGYFKSKVIRVGWYIFSCSLILSVSISFVCVPCVFACACFASLFFCHCDVPQCKFMFIYVMSQGHVIFYIKLHTMSEESVG